MYYIGYCTASVHFILLSVFWVFVECQPQAPYVSFMGEIISNHAYIDINQIGEGANSLRCHTDLVTCCSASEGSVHRGAWLFTIEPGLKASSLGMHLAVAQCIG